MGSFCRILIAVATVAVALALWPGIAEAQCKDCAQFEVEPEEEPPYWVHFFTGESGGSTRCDGHGTGCHETGYTLTCSGAGHQLCLVPAADVDVESLSRRAVQPEHLRAVRTGLADETVLWDAANATLLFRSACDDMAVVAAVVPSPDVREALALSPAPVPGR